MNTTAVVLPMSRVVSSNCYACSSYAIDNEREKKIHFKISILCKLMYLQCLIINESPLVGSLNPCLEYGSYAYILHHVVYMNLWFIDYEIYNKLQFKQQQKIVPEMNPPFLKIEGLNDRPENATFIYYFHFNIFGHF